MSTLICGSKDGKGRTDAVGAMKQGKIKEVQPPDRARLGERIGALADRLGSRVNAARVAGISTDQLARYISGSGEISLSPIARLAERAGFRLDWVATGAEPMMAVAPSAREPAAGYPISLDADRLTRVVGAVEMLLPGWAPAERAALIVLAYDYMTACGTNDRDVLAAFLRQWAKSAVQPAVPDFHSPEVTGEVKGAGKIEP